MTILIIVNRKTYVSRHLIQERILHVLKMKGVKTIKQAKLALQERTPDEAFFNEMMKAGHLQVKNLHNMKSTCFFFLTLKSK